MAVRGFKSKIAFNMAFLLLISAMITDILAIVVIQTVWIKTKIERDQAHIESLGRLFFAPIPGIDHEAVLDRNQMIVSTLLDRNTYPALLMSDQSKHYFFQSSPNTVPRQQLEEILSRAISAREPQKEKLGLGWSVFWWQAQSILVAIPVVYGADRIAGIAAVIPLTPVYDQLRSYNKPVLIYILINTAILTLVGLYRMFRIYLRPIDRIVDQANQYHDDHDFLFAFRREDNELNRLSSALNQMLGQIGADKQKLKEMVVSLEAANRELRQAQSDIIRAEKMAAIGRLAAGIAHEIGNPIGIVLGYIDLLNQDDLSPHERNDYLQRVETEIQRINTIIRQLLDLARPQKAEKQAVCIHSVLNELVGVMRMLPIMDGIDLQVALNAQKETVWADGGQLRQVFLNLVINAADAIKGDPSNTSGRITIRTENGTASSSEGRSFLTVSIEDNGPGIPTEDMDNIFDPFFTTKAPGKGTGLGLAVSYTMVEQLGGAMHAGNRKETGAVIDIHLPIHDAGETRGSCPAV